MHFLTPLYVFRHACLLTHTRYLVWCKQVFDEDIGDDKRLGVAKLPLAELQAAGRSKEVELRLLPSLDMLKIKDKKDRGTLVVQVDLSLTKIIHRLIVTVGSCSDHQVKYHEFNKEEQLAALEEEKRLIEERHKLKEEGVIGSTVDAVDETLSAVGAGVSTGAHAGAGKVGSGLGAVGTGLSKAGKFVGRTIHGHGKKSGATTPVNSVQENGGAKPRPT